MPEHFRAVMILRNARHEMAGARPQFQDAMQRGPIAHKPNGAYELSAGEHTELGMELRQVLDRRTQINRIGLPFRKQEWLLQGHKVSVDEEVGVQLAEAAFLFRVGLDLLGEVLACADQIDMRKHPLKRCKTSENFARRRIAWFAAGKGGRDVAMIGTGRKKPVTHSPRGLGVFRRTLTLSFVSNPVTTCRDPLICIRVFPGLILKPAPSIFPTVVALVLVRFQRTA